MRRLIAVVLLVSACSATGGAIETDTTTPFSSSTTRAPTSTTVETTSTTTTTTIAAVFSVSSPAFDDGGEIPLTHTCDGADVSPELNIVGIPPDAESLALVVDDPDAPLGTWDHWVVFDLPADAGAFIFERGTDPVGSQGVNSWHLPGYMGPCPPDGETHEYVFTVYALSKRLGLSEGVTSSQVLAAMEGSIVARAQLTGFYTG